MDCDNSPTSKMVSRIPNIIDQRREKCLATAQTIATLKKCLLVVLCRISSFLGQGDVGIWGDFGVCTINNYGDLFWSLVKTRDTIYGDLYWSLLLQKSIKMTNFLRLLTGQKSLSEGVAKCSDCSDQFGSWFRAVTKMREKLVAIFLEPEAPIGLPCTAPCLTVSSRPRIPRPARIISNNHLSHV